MFTKDGLKSSLVLTIVLLVVLACSAFAQQTGEYKLSSEDVIVVTTLTKPEFSGEYLVPQDGMINFPGVGLVTVTGKSVVDLGKEIEGALAKRLQKPEVYVTLKSQKQQLVYVLGAAGRTGPLVIKPGWRLSEVVSAAGGGATGEPADQTVTLFRSGGTKEVVPMPDILAGTEGKNFPVQGNDMIVIDKIEQYQVYVAGKVRNSGVFPVRKDNNSILNVLTMAGGATDDGAISKVTLTHITGETEVIDLTPFIESGKLDAAPKVRSGDLIVVPESRKRFAVMGWVRTPSFYTMRDNEKLTLSEVLSMAGGVDPKRGGTGNIAVLRTVDGKQQRMIFDYRKFIAKGDATQNPVILAGDVVWVPETGAIDWDRWIGRISSGLGTWYTVDRIANPNRP